MRSRAAGDDQPTTVAGQAAKLFSPGNEGLCFAVIWEHWRKHYHEETDNLVRELLPHTGGHEFAVWEDRFTGNVMVERKHPEKAYWFAGKEHMKRLV